MQNATKIPDLEAPHNVTHDAETAKISVSRHKIVRTRRVLCGCIPLSTQGIERNGCLLVHLPIWLVIISVSVAIVYAVVWIYVTPISSSKPAPTKPNNVSLFRTFDTKDHSKPAGEPLNATEIQTYLDCENARRSLDFESFYREHCLGKCSEDYGILSTLTLEACLLGKTMAAAGVTAPVSWGSSSNVCEWKGVKCDQDSYIRELTINYTLAPKEYKLPFEYLTKLESFSINSTISGETHTISLAPILSLPKLSSFEISNVNWNIDLETDLPSAWLLQNLKLDNIPNWKARIPPQIRNLPLKSLSLRNLTFDEDIPKWLNGSAWNEPIRFEITDCCSNGRLYTNGTYTFSENCT